MKKIETIATLATIKNPITKVNLASRMRGTSSTSIANANTNTNLYNGYTQISNMHVPPFNACLGPGVTWSTKSDFEKVVDSLFTHEEKADFLISVGYQVDIYSSTATKFSDIDSEKPHTPPAPFYDINTAFMCEISIKFKNLLLTKPLLKIKI